MTQLGVITQDTPTQPQAQSPTVDSEPPQIEDIQRERIPALIRRALTSELSQLLIAEEEQEYYHSPHLL